MRATGTMKGAEARGEGGGGREGRGSDVALIQVSVLVLVRSAGIGS